MGKLTPEPTKADLLDEIKQLQRENNNLIEENGLLTHKIITCGVAASHPDSSLSYRASSYGGVWDSPQAQRVRALRKDRDQMLELAEDAAAAWQQNEQLQVANLLRAIKEPAFRELYRPDLYEEKENKHD